MTCRPRDDISKPFTDYCWVGFVKLAFDRRQLFTEQELNVDELLAAVYRQLDISDKSFKDVRMYMKMVDYEGILVIDYIVVQFYVSDYIKMFMERFHGRFCPIGYSNEIAYCEFVVYEPTNNLDEFLNVPNPNDLTTESLRPFGFMKEPMNTGMCTNKPLRVINKLVFCIHIELREDEFDMEIRNTFLVIKENLEEFTFSSWEYEKIDEVVKLCLDDYLTVYKSVPFKRQPGNEQDNVNSDLTDGDVFEMPLQSIIIAVIMNGLAYII